jgi:nitrogen fixation protein NifB
MSTNQESFSMHPCFDPQARHLYGRIHLPVAPRCNIQCNYCNRKFDCANETRPGVTSAVLKPRQALAYLDAALAIDPNIAVMGIAGPGDPFANPDETMETFRLVRRKYPHLILCVSTNGLAISPHIAELAELKISHVTVTINAVDPEIGARIYSWARGSRTNKVFRGVAAAKSLLEHQLMAVEELKERGITVKVNSIILPGINDEHIPEVAEKVKSLGADIMNCIPFIPVQGTPYENKPEPSGAVVARVRLQAKAHLPQMAHCARCRSDAVGLLGELPCKEFDGLLKRFAGAYSPLDERPYVAVATKDGVLVNAHLGSCQRFQIYAKRDDGYECIDTRPLPPLCCGQDRWAEFGKLLHDCRAVLVSAAGAPPKRKLEELGILVVDNPCMIQDGLDEIYADEDLTHLRARIGAGCPGPEEGATGCGS